ncbi:transcription factor bHLH36 isoform X2 [Cajanus cajan]|uniref:transcription factor bHLH36 isoform X2 n=1 Tax=Cajanus cajan TaxID=3821 RepID=UPI0010FAE5F4|nr:transcription factor bHLH36 isoform X2 [Cajanus cajan]
MPHQSLQRQRKYKYSKMDMAGEVDSNLIWEGFQNPSISGEWKVVSNPNNRKHLIFLLWYLCHPKKIAYTMMNPLHTSQVRKSSKHLLVGEKEDYKLAMDENKKWMHKETERQRRQEMAKHCTTLRSLLPIEYIKGKRSIADHVYEAMNYINHLQNKVKQLQAKRDELAKVSNLSNVGPDEKESSSTTNHLPPLVFVHPFPGGLEIMCSYSFKKSVFPMSRVLDILLKEGLNVVSTTSIKRDGRFVHTIQSEDPFHPNMIATDYSELQIKLMEAVSFSSNNCTIKYFVHDTRILFMFSFF